MSTDPPRTVAGNGHFLRTGADQWVYSLTGAAVPGARDVTLAEQFAPLGRLDSTGDAFLFPAALAGLDLHLRLLVDPELQTLPHEVAVPWERWRDAQSRVVGLYAPELRADLLLAQRDAAAVLSFTPASFRHARWRGYAPAWVVMAGDYMPLWSIGVLEQWRTLAGRRDF